MISSGRPLVGKEKIFLNLDYRVYVQFALQVENPKDIPPIIYKLKKAISGFYFKTDGVNFLPNFKDEESVTIHRIPNKIKNLSECCDWIYRTFTPASNYSLASICADDTRVVVNSSHSLTDGGYINFLIDDIQNPLSKSLFDTKVPIPGILREELLKKDFDDFLKNNINNIHNYPSFNTNDITHLNTQEIVTIPDSDDSILHRFKHEMECEEFSPHIYDKNTQKVNHLSEYLWTGFCLSINAKNKIFGPIGVETVVDFRRLIDRKRVNSKFGNAYTSFGLCIKNPNPQMTIGEMCSEFRNKFNRMKENDWFFKEFLFPVDFRRDFCPVAHVSNVGPVEIKSPLKDIYMQVSGKEMGSRSYLQVTSFSKRKKEKGENVFVLQMGYSPSIISDKNADDIFKTYIHFLKTANPKKKSGDVLDELIHFQKSLW